MTRYAIEPDPAWDWCEVQDGRLTVELSWRPDALAGRLEEIVAGPDLVRALREAGITGFTTGEARGLYPPDGFGVDEGTPPPALLQLHVGADAAQDLSYIPRCGLVASEAALAVLSRFCDRMDVRPLP